MENPTLKFYETIGPHYVYGYWCNEQDKWRYIGKGVGNRVQHHVGEKGYDLEDAHILVQNLPDDKTAALVEALLIHEHDPIDNKVRGHHTERFVMASLKGLFGDFVDGQRNYHYELTETLTAHESVFRTTMGGCNSSGSGYNIWSSVRKSTNLAMSVSGDGILLKIQSQPTPGNTEHYQALRDKVVPMLTKDYEVIEVPNKNGVGGRLEFWVEDIPTAVQLWEDFNS